jgi:hypothetical protein
MTGDFVRWLLHDDQKELFEILFALILNLVFLALIALLLWRLERVRFALDLAAGFGGLWILLVATFVFLSRVQRVFRVNLYERVDAYLVSNLFVSCFLQTGWAAFAALTLPDYAAGAAGWMVVALYLVGGFSCLVAFHVVSAFYQGHIYRFISLPVALASFLVFNLWPASARVFFGWFFDLF